jgi:hypothetical protein
MSRRINARWGAEARDPMMRRSMTRRAGKESFPDLSTAQTFFSPSMKFLFVLV